MTSRKMNFIGAMALCVVAIFSCAPVEASIIISSGPSFPITPQPPSIANDYHVSFSDGTETVTGTIGVNGPIGQLYLSSLSHWTFTVSGPLSFTISSLDGTGDLCWGLGCGIDVSLTELVFTGGVDPYISFVDISGAMAKSLTFKQGAIIVYTSTQLPFSSNRYDLSTPTQTNYVVGTATVPEPGTVSVLALGLACLAFVSKRPEGRIV